MSTETEMILDLIGKKSRVQIVAGFFRGVDGLRATVDFSDGRVPANFTSSYMPELNEPVWVLVADGVAYMLGPTRPKPTNGVIATITGGVASVQTDLGRVDATFDLGRTYSSGDAVKLLWGDGCWILGVRSDVRPDPEVPPAPGGGGGRRTVTFTAIDSGAYENSWWQNDVWCSARNIGAWFYGNKFRDTIPDDASIISARIYLPQTKNLGAAPFGRHGFATKPVGAVTFAAVSELPEVSGRRTGWRSIPVGLIDHLKSNTGGLGFAGGGYSIWAGTQKDAQSGAVRVTYTT